jgi:hypothetical protein
LIRSLLTKVKGNFSAGGKIRFFGRNWKALTGDKWTQDTVLHGLSIPLKSPPHQSKEANTIPMNAEQKAIVSAEIERMVSKHVVRLAQDVPDQYVSNVFVRTNPDTKKHRMILNLKNLNHFVKYQHFKMETLSQISQVIQTGDFLVKIDLKDAFWSIPIHKSFQKLMRFRWEGSLYEFTTLAFGLGPAPWAFTKVMKVPVSLMRRLGIRLMIYLDDILIAAKSFAEACQARDTMIFLLENLGLTVNWEKSILCPSHQMEYLGMEIDTQTMSILLPEKKIDKLTSLCQSVGEKSSLTLRELSQLIGKLYATAPALTPAPLQLRSLQQDLISGLKRNLSYSDQISLSGDASKEIKWWLINLKIRKGRPLLLQNPEMIIYSDAAKTQGWGAAMEGGPSTGGSWSLQEKQSFHINALELMAAELAIKTFVKLHPVKSIHIRIDNTCALTYLLKMGGTKSKTLTEISKRIWDFLLSQEITLTASWISSELNWRADEESRAKPNASDWMLSSTVWQEIAKKWGRPSIDCFATRTMRQVERYTSRRLDPFSEGSNGLYQPWRNEFPYLFPPFCLIGQVLRKVQREKVEQAILIAPLWAGQPWFPSLLEMCVQHPLQLPLSPDLLTNQEGQSHPLVQNQTLLMGAFLVSGNPSRTRDYLKGLPASSWGQNETRRSSLTSRVGKSGILGALRGKLIPIMQM